ncbi:MAG TPA: hydantoinase/oxoprolinase family protein [Aggregatilineales bacterium]|nr:hydantoinase/oxoprolinase family protein [Aggregatilineales bacterium]
MRIGIDVGGTNTDAILMDGNQVMATYKSPTTANVTDGIVSALYGLLNQTRVSRAQVQGVMIGTTHFTNAVVERQRLERTACIRLGLPATTSLPPFSDWPDELLTAIDGTGYLAHGGHEFDGRVITPIDEAEIHRIAEDIQARGIRCVAISSVFSPVNADFEDRAGAIVKAVIPDARVTLSHTIGRIGLLERENAAIMNSCLSRLAEKTVQGFRTALADMQFTAPLYISQNDGTLISAEFAQTYPVLTFASGPTNSMRGAAFLTGLRDAIVIDVGGTTTDIGVLQHGFPRPSGLTSAVGGVRTNFRMPDVESIGLGGGTIVRVEPFRVGPQSVGYELTTRARVFGGDTLTTTDVIVAAGRAEIGDKSAVAGLDQGLVRCVFDRIEAMINQTVDQVKTSAEPIPAVLVGGGSILIQRDIAGISEIVRPPHFAVANAIGAAIAQVGGELERIFSLAETSREQALELARQEAVARAVTAGAARNTVEIVEIEEVPLAYLPGSATRIRVKAVGDLGA